MLIKPGTKSLSANIDSDLLDKFGQQTESRGFKKKWALTGAVKLWLSLPRELKAYVLSNEPGEDLLIDMINYAFKNPLNSFRERLKVFMGIPPEH